MLNNTVINEFEAMLGFTQLEVNKLLEQVYNDYDIDSNTRDESKIIVKNHYNGYHFVSSDGEAIYNST